MKRSKPDNDDSTHGTKCSLDRGDLSEWEYLTKFYDHDEMLDDHHLSVATRNEALLPSAQGHSHSIIPSNLSLHEPFHCDHSTAMEPKYILPHGIDCESNSVKSELLLYSFHLDTERSHYQHVAESDLSKVVVSSDSQRWMINPARYFDPYQHTARNDNAQQKPAFLESSSIMTHQDGSSAYDHFFERPAFLHSHRQDSALEPSTNTGHRFACNSTDIETIDGNVKHRTEHLLNHDRKISETHTNLSFEPSFMKNDRHITNVSKELPLEDQEPVSIRSEEDVSQHSDWGCHGSSAAKEKTIEEVSDQHFQFNKATSDGSDLARIRVVDVGTRLIIADAVQNKNRSNDSLFPHRTDAETVSESVSRAPALVTGNTHQHMTTSFDLQNQIVPPYQQLNNNSLLLKPLTPYNYYYRDERDNIVLQISDENDPLPPPVSDFSIEKMQSLLKQHWYVDPVRAKRIHRKTHGKMSFQNLSKIISERWRALPSQGREFYRSVARSDEMYYNQHLINLLGNEGYTGSGPATTTEAEEDERKPHHPSTEQGSKTKNLPNSDGANDTD